MTEDVKYPHIRVQLTGGDSNAYAIIGAVKAAIRRAVGQEAAEAYSAEAMAQESYDALLRHAMRTVVVD